MVTLHVDQTEFGYSCAYRPHCEAQVHLGAPDEEGVAPVSYRFFEEPTTLPLDGDVPSTESRGYNHSGGEVLPRTSPVGAFPADGSQSQAMILKQLQLDLEGILDEPVELIGPN